MPYDFENMDLSSNPIDVRLVLDLVLLENLDGNLLTGDEVST